MRKTRTPLLTTLLMFILCTTILVGATTAYFTETVQVSGNVVQSGNLKAEMYWTENLVPGENNEIQWIDASKEAADDKAIFSYEQWEPGFTAVRFLQIRNAGRLAFQYQLNVLPQGELIGKANLMDAIDVYYGPVPQQDAAAQPSLNVKDYASFRDFTEALGLECMGTLSQLNAHTREHTWGVMLPSVATPNAELPAGVTASTGAGEFCIVLHMQEDAGNEYQQCGIEKGFVLQLTATQYTYEKDSFGHDYDAEAVSMLPVYTSPVTVTADITGKVSPEGKLTEAVTLSSGDVSAIVPAGAQITPGATSLTLRITPMALSGANLTLGQTEETASYDVHVEGIDPANTLPLTITMGEVLPTGLNMGNYSLHHVENGETVKMNYVASGTLEKHNDFKYDPATGFVTVAMAQFSEVAVVAEPAKWEGEFDYTWYTNAAMALDGEAVTEYIIANADQLAGFGAIVGGMAKDENGIALDRDSFSGKTVKLIADIDLGDKNNANESLIFHPIGYYYNENYNFEDGTTGKYSTVKSFEGTFDGNGHTIANFYHNTWEIKGDYDGNYYKDAMGLFGYVASGKVCNLTVDNFSSDGEFTPTGVIAAYAINSTFENIAITNCNPRVYNTGNGGIVGIGGNSDDPDAYKLTFTNITIDNTNTISALWGSWDVACGGLVGMFRGDGHVHMTNCHVAAQMDVNNDVCGNYQYYWYRYSGMMIGTNVNMTTDANGYTVPETDKFHANECTVHFGEWNDYYYCELVANSIASYTHDHQFSRLEQISSLDEIKNGDTWTKAGNFLLISGDTKTCYHIVKNGNTLKQHLHTDAGTETINGETVPVEDKTCVYLPFNQLFTGYGWGVKHIPVYNGEDYAFEGIKILDRVVADSVTKFDKADTAKDSYTTETSVTIGELFKAATITDPKLSIKSDKVQVSISPVGSDSTAGGTYTANTTDWTQGTLTFSGVGKAQITITDYYFCKPTTIEITINATDKFAKLFDKNFLYRVGNQNTVALGSLFKAINDSVEITNAIVEIDSIAGNASGTYTSNASWEKGAIQFKGTGVVNVTISGSDAKPVTLTLEVVDATNITSATGTTTGGDMVLLCDVNATTYVNYWNCTLYGNGFIYSLNGAPTAYNSKQGHGVLITKNATLDNLVIVGDVYNSYGAYTNQDYYNAAVDVVGDTVIQNCYISNCASPVLARASVTITDTTLYGGTVANLLIKSGVVTLENVTTANYDDGRSLVGMGIVVHSDATAATKLVLNGTLTQYNFVSEAKTPSDSNAKILYNAMFDSSCSNYHFGTSPNRYVNAGVISMTANFNGDNIVDNANTGYVGSNVTVNDVNGYVYTQLNTNGSVNNNYNKDNDSHISNTQGAVAPSYSFDYTNRNYLAKTDGSNDYCYAENGIVYISMDDGDTFNWDTAILTATKLGQTLGYTVSMNGTDYTGKSIAFNKAGSYEALYTYTDDSNYGVDEEGNITTYSKTYTKTVYITVATVKTAWKNAEIKVTNTAMSGIYVMSGDYDYSYKMKVLDCITITDYDEAGNATTVTLSEDIASTSFVDVNGANPGKFDANNGTITITYSSGKILTVKIGAWSGSGPSAKTCSVKTDDGVYLITDGASNAANTGVTWKITGYTYTGNNGAIVENNTTITFTWDTNSEGYNSKSECLTPSTLITLADGSQTRVDSLTGDEQLLVWNLETGKLDAAPILFIDSEPEAEYQIVHLYFSDGTDVEVIFEHGFWDYDLNKYVYLDENAAQYIGHSFFKRSGDSGEKVTLTSVVIENQTTTAWSPVTAGHLCYFVNGMLSMPGGIGGLFNIFDVDPITMTYDTEAMARDIETYGLFTYEELAAHCPALTEEMFEAAGGAYLKVSIGKGNMTMDELIEMINRYAKFF